MSDKEKNSVHPIPNQDSMTGDLFPDNEIDEFTKALLDKKTEMALYTEVMNTPDEPEPEAVSIQERKEAEGTMADALDELRRERGQVPIDQEEEDFAWSQTVKFEDRFADTGDDFTTESLFHSISSQDSEPSVSEYALADKESHIERPEKRPVTKKKTKSRAARNKAKAEQEAAQKQAAQKAEVIPAVPVSEELPETQSESSSSKESGYLSRNAADASSVTSQMLEIDRKKKAAAAAAAAGAAAAGAAVQAGALKADASKGTPEVPGKLPRAGSSGSGSQPPVPDQGKNKSVVQDKQNYNFDDEPERRSKAWIWILLAVLVLLIGGGLFYKFQVYDPAHQPSETQTENYNTLAGYANDFDKLTEEQKKKMADLLTDYSNLTDTQKNDLNQLFKDKTGKSFTDLVASIQSGTNNASNQKDDKKDDQNSEDQNAANNANGSPADSNQGAATPAADGSNGNQADNSALEQGNSGTQSGTSPNGSGQSTPGASVSGNQGTANGTQSTVPSNGSNGTASGSNGSGNAAVNEQIARYQQEIASLQQDKADYIEFLQTEGLPESDDITAAYDTQIAYYQNLLNSLQ